MSDQRWWEQAVFYQIYPRSFADGNGDGVGDLAGVIDKLDYLQWLGIDALWLSPIFTSPMADFGYDVANYCDIDPVFGSLEQFDELLAAAHSRDMRVTVDWVPNHSSNEHPWFVESRQSVDSAKRDWYVWRDPAPDGGPPNNWLAAFGPYPAWTLDEKSGQYYLHLFLPEQPDLNWENPEVEEAMLDTLRFWLDRGVDGFRADVVNLIGKGPELPSLDQPASPLTMDPPRVHQHLRNIRSVLDSYEQRPMMVGELVIFDLERLRAYYGNDDELHLGFNFRPIGTGWEAEKFGQRVVEVEEHLTDDAWPVWVLGNHDRQRQRTRYGTDDAARAAAVLLLTVRGTPYLYAGEELGLADASIPDAAVVDPGGRDGCRAPIPWTRGEGHGWGQPTWLPFVDDAATRSVEAQRGQRGSTLELYRSLLRLRREHAALRHGALEVLDTAPGALAWRRSHDGDQVDVVVNFTPQPLSVSQRGVVLVTSAHPNGAVPGSAFNGVLSAGEAIVLG